MHRRPDLRVSAWDILCLWSNFTVTPFISGATCLLRIVLFSLNFKGLTSAGPALNPLWQLNKSFLHQRPLFPPGFERLMLDRQRSDF
jgi:hypothetical protein